MTAVDIRFVRLPTLEPEVIVAHMSDPRVVAHMPLATGGWDVDRARAFVAAKEACWQRDGLGHWGILDGDRYVGWGGFEREGEAWDFGLVLTPDAFGLGPRILRKALRLARSELGIDAVTFLLAPSRRSLSGLERLGARYLGEVDVGGQTFLRYRLEL